MFIDGFVFRHSVEVYKFIKFLHNLDVDLKFHTLKQNI